MLVEVVGIKDVELGVYLLRGMGAKLQLTVNHILHHLEHTVLHLFGVVRLLNVLFQQPKTFFLYLFLGTKEDFAPLVGFGDVLVHVNANQDAHLIYIVEERPQSEIARCTEKAHHGIKVLDLRVIFEYALKLFHQSVPIPIGEEMGSDWYLYHTLSFCSARTIFRRGWVQTKNLRTRKSADWRSSMS